MNSNFKVKVKQVISCNYYRYISVYCFTTQFNFQQFTSVRAAYQKAPNFMPSCSVNLFFFWWCVMLTLWFRPEFSEKRLKNGGGGGEKTKRCSPPSYYFNLYGANFFVRCLQFCQRKNKMFNYKIKNLGPKGCQKIYFYKIYFLRK